MDKTDCLTLLMHTRCGVITETATLNTGTCTRSRVITDVLDSSKRIHGAINVEEKGNYHSVHRDSYTQHRHMHKKYRVITYFLNFSRWIHRAVHVEERDITIRFTETPTLNAGTCTRSRVITHILDSSKRIHGAINVEEKGNYHSVHRDSYTQCRHMHKE